MNTFFIFPTMLIYLIMYDLIYSIANTMILPFLIIASLIMRDNYIEPFETFLDRIMVYSTGMSYMDIKGFRSQRTILQFQLESIPQLMFQSYLLIRLRQLNRDGDQNSLGISIWAIEFSLIMAVTHVLLELLNLYLESTTWKSGFRDYMIACHNAKQGWIAQSTSFNANEEMDMNAKQKNSITFDDKVEHFFGFGFQVQFSFTDLSIDPLINIISNLPKVEDRTRRTTVQLGKCISEVSVKKLIQLLKLSYQKVNLEFINPEINLRKIFEKNHEFMQQLNDPYQENEEEVNFKSKIKKETVPILIEMVQKDYHQVVEVLVELGAKFALRTKDGDETLFKIAFRNNYPETMRVLLQYINKDTQYVKASIIEGEMFYDEIFLRDERKSKPICPQMLMEPKCLIPYEMQISLMYNIPKLIKKDKGEGNVARDQFQYLYSAFMPPVTFQIGDDMETCIPIIKSWLDRYPETYTVCAFEVKASFQSSFLSTFVCFRRELYKLKTLGFNPISPTFKRMIDIVNYDIEINDLVKVYNIINQPGEVDQFDIKLCDGVVRKFGLDKKRDSYFYQSRKLYKGEQTLSRSHVENVVMDKQWFEHPIKIPEDVVAIKSLKLTMQSDSVNEARQTFKVFVEYNNGHQKAELKPNLSLVVDPNAEEQQIGQQEISLLNIEFGSVTDKDPIEKIKLYQTLLMNIESNNLLTFKFKSEKPLPANKTHQFKLDFEFYLRQEESML